MRTGHLRAIESRLDSSALIKLLGRFGRMLSFTPLMGAAIPFSGRCARWPNEAAPQKNFCVPGPLLYTHLLTAFLVILCWAAIIGAWPSRSLALHTCRLNSIKMGSPYSRLRYYEQLEQFGAMYQEQRIKFVQDGHDFLPTTSKPFVASLPAVKCTARHPSAAKEVCQIPAHAGPALWNTNVFTSHIVESYLYAESRLGDRAIRSNLNPKPSSMNPHLDI